MLNKLIESDKKQTTELEEIKRTLTTQSEQLKANEMNRLKAFIIDVACQLRNGLEMDSTSYEMVFEAYKQYKALGGNGYAESEFNYIKKRKKELDGVVTKKE